MPKSWPMRSYRVRPPPPPPLSGISMIIGVDAKPLPMLHWDRACCCCCGGGGGGGADGGGWGLGACCC